MSNFEKCGVSRTAEVREYVALVLKRVESSFMREAVQDMVMI